MIGLFLSPFYPFLQGVGGIVYPFKARPCLPEAPTRRDPAAALSALPFATHPHNADGSS